MGLAFVPKPRECCLVAKRGGLWGGGTAGGMLDMGRAMALVPYSSPRRPLRQVLARPGFARSITCILGHAYSGACIRS